MYEYLVYYLLGDRITDILDLILFSFIALVFSKYTKSISY